MKNTSVFLIAPFFMLLLYGCPIPYSAPVALPNLLDYDTRINGTWHQNDSTKEVTQFTIGPDSEKQRCLCVKLHVDKRGNSYESSLGDDYRAWAKKISTHNFIILEQKDSTGAATYIHYVYRFEKGKLTTWNFNIEGVALSLSRDSDAIRKTLEQEINGPRFHLTEKTEWSKVKKKK